MAGNAGPTVLDLITEALSILSVYTPGEPMAAADAETCLFTLGGLVDGYGAERLTIYQLNVLAQFATTAGKQTYLVGTGATGNDWIVSALPTRFEYVSQSLANRSATGALEVGLHQYTNADWERLSLKSLGNTMLEGVWINYGVGAHALSFFPLPLAAIPITLYTAQMTPRFTALTNVLALPPGYQELLTYELALKVASKFDATIPPFLPDAFAEAKSRVKMANFQALDIRCDPALTGHGGGRSGLDFYKGL